MSERPAKRARGSYAKLICLRCRERRIKCQLPDDGTVKPSPDPQPPDRACQRCQQQGFECIVRKTTLGRPSQKRPELLTLSSGQNQDDSRSPSPEAEDLVLLTLDDRHGRHNRRSPSVGIRPTSVQLIAAVGKNFDLTSGLLARDPRFGSAIMDYRDGVPPSLNKLIDQDLAILLDEHLVWQRLYIPWLPYLADLYNNKQKFDLEGQSSTTLLMALLASIALDTPSHRITRERRQLQHDLQNIVYHEGQKVLFTLPKHRDTITALVLVHGYRPLALIHSRQAAAHTLSGKLYPTLISALQRQLGIHSAPSRLRACLDDDQNDEIHQLVFDSIQWASTLTFQIASDLEEIETDNPAFCESEQELTDAFDSIGSAIDKGLAPDKCFFSFHLIRYHADHYIAMRNLTLNWNNLPKLSSILHEYEKLCEQRRKGFERDLIRFVSSQGRTGGALAYSQLSNMELNQGRTNLIGLSMFYAIVSGAQNVASTTTSERNGTVQLNKYYTDALHQEVGLRKEAKTEVRKFLEQWGGVHMDGLERRLTDFINAAAEVQLNGISFVGPARHVSTNVLLACKEIVENNAVRIKLDGELHCRADMQLILFQETARKLKAMEADGDTAEAVARGSILAASAKLILSLHRIMSQWKRNYICHHQQQRNQQDTGQTVLEGSPRVGDVAAPLYTGLPFEPKVRTGMPFDLDDLFTEDFLTDWDNWPRLDNADISNFFTSDSNSGTF